MKKIKNILLYVALFCLALLLGFVYFDKKRDEQVEQLLFEAVDVMNQDMLELAADKCGSAISINKRDWRPYAMRSLVYHRLGKNNEAIPDYEEALKYNKNKESLDINGIKIEWRDIATRLAFTYAAEENDSHFDDALVLAQKVLSEFPNDKDALDAISMVYFRKEDYVKAEEWAKKLRDVDEASGLFRLGYYYSVSGKTLEAIEAFERLLAIKPNSGPALYSLALNYQSYFGENERWIGTRYFPPTTNTDFYYKAIRLHQKAALLGYNDAKEWLKKRDLDW